MTKQDWKKIRDQYDKAYEEKQKLQIKCAGLKQKLNNKKYREQNK